MQISHDFFFKELACAVNMIFQRNGNTGRKIVTIRVSTYIALAI